MANYNVALVVDTSSRKRKCDYICGPVVGILRPSNDEIARAKAVLDEVKKFSPVEKAKAVLRAERDYTKASITKATTWVGWKTFYYDEMRVVPSVLSKKYNVSQAYWSGVRIPGIHSATGNTQLVLHVKGKLANEVNRWIRIHCMIHS